MVTIIPYGSKTQATAISPQNSGGNGYVGNAGMQALGQAIGGVADRALGIDAESKKRQELQDANRNKFEADIEERERQRFMQSEKISAFAKLSDLDMDVGAEAEELKSKIGAGANGYTDSFSQSLDKKIGTFTKDLSFHQKQFLEPQLVDFKTRRIADAKSYERTENINNNIANVQKVQKSFLDKVNGNSVSANEAIEQNEMMIETLGFNPDVARKLREDFEGKAREQQITLEMEQDPQKFLSKFKPKINIDSLGIPQTEVTDIVFEKSKQYGVDPLLGIAIQQQENPNQTKGLKSPKGAIGEMQLMLGTAQELGVDPYDTEQNIDGGIRYFSQKLKENNGDVELALASYNAGYGNVKKYGGIPPFKETQDYVKKIMQGYEALKQAQSEAGTQAQQPTILEREAMGKAQSLVERIRKQARINAKEQRVIRDEAEKQQEKKVQEYAEKARYNSDIISREDLDAALKSGKISYKNANVIKKTISSIEKQKNEGATDQTKIEILKNSDLVDEVFRNQILNSDIPDEQKLEILHFTDQIINEKAKQQSDIEKKDFSNIQLAIINGEITVNEIKQSGVLKTRPDLVVKLEATQDKVNKAQETARIKLEKQQKAQMAQRKSDVATYVMNKPENREKPYNPQAVYDEQEQMGIPPTIRKVLPNGISFELSSNLQNVRSLDDLMQWHQAVEQTVNNDALLPNAYKQMESNDNLPREYKTVLMLDPYDDSEEIRYIFNALSSGKEDFKQVFDATLNANLTTTSDFKSNFDQKTAGIMDIKVMQGESFEGVIDSMDSIKLIAEAHYIKHKDADRAIEFAKNSFVKKYYNDGDELEQHDGKPILLPIKKVNDKNQALNYLDIHKENIVDEIFYVSDIENRPINESTKEQIVDNAYYGENQTGDGLVMFAETGLMLLDKNKQPIQVFFNDMNKHTIKRPNYQQPNMMVIPRG